MAYAIKNSNLIPIFCPSHSLGAPLGDQLYLCSDSSTYWNVQTGMLWCCWKMVPGRVLSIMMSSWQSQSISLVSTNLVRNAHPWEVLGSGGFPGCNVYWIAHDPLLSKCSCDCSNSGPPLFSPLFLCRLIFLLIKAGRFCFWDVLWQYLLPLRKSKRVLLFFST